jgi:DNA-binding response OmpR family regulator
MTHRILILDDEEVIVFALREFFTAHGYSVDGARDLAEAQALFGTGERYALVIADLRLGGTQGTEGLEFVALARERRPAIRTILLTAYGSPEVEAEARRRGVDAFLHKPQPLIELAQTVRRLLSVPA